METGSSGQNESQRIPFQSRSGESSDGFRFVVRCNLFHPERHFLPCFRPYHSDSVIVREATCERLAGSLGPDASNDRSQHARACVNWEPRKGRVEWGQHEIESTADHLSVGGSAKATGTQGNGTEAEKEGKGSALLWNLGKQVCTNCTKNPEYRGTGWCEPCLYALLQDQDL